MKNKLITISISIIIGFILFEYILKKLNIPNRKEIARIGWNYLDNNILIDSINQLGFRGKKYQLIQHSNIKKILIIGDSQVEANGLPYQFTIENLLQNKLNNTKNNYQYLCFSLGSSGYGQDQEFLALQEYFKKYKADEVILWFTPENDIWNNIFPTHWPWNGNPKPTYWIENNQLKGPNFGYLDSIKFKSNLNSMRILEILKWNTSLNSLDNQWETKLPAIEKSNFVNPSKSYTEFKFNSADENIDKGKTHFLMFQKITTKRLEYGIQLTHQILKKIETLCKNNQANFSIFICEGSLSSEIKDNMYINSQNKYYELSKTQYHKNLDLLFNGFKYNYIQLKCEWKAISKQDNFHLNHEAQKEFSDSICIHLLERFNPTPPY